ncbi:MAG: hypothetical protein H6579_09835 [Chitinophagales bacterium]|nr:hypothetical protein [Chitinophagales bacterium]
MQYKVLPFISNVSFGSGQNEAVRQLESFIERETIDGWEFVSCGNINTNIAGSNGCFGIGSTPDRSISTLVMIFKK